MEDIAPQLLETLRRRFNEKISKSARAQSLLKTIQDGKGTYFNVGDTKSVALTATDGTTTDVEFEIVGINHDDLADGSGKAGLSIVAKTALSFYAFTGTSLIANLSTGWAASAFRTLCNDSFYNDVLPEEVRTHVKEVAKVTTGAATAYDLETTNDFVWFPSITEIIGTSSYAKYDQGIQYEHFKTAVNRKKYGQNATEITSSTVLYGTRSNNSLGTTSTKKTYKSNIDENGSIKVDGTAVSYAAIGFCI